MDQLTSIDLGLVFAKTVGDVAVPADTVRSMRSGSKLVAAMEPLPIVGSSTERHLDVQNEPFAVLDTQMVAVTEAQDPLARDIHAAGREAIVLSWAKHWQPLPRREFVDSHRES